MNLVFILSIILPINACSTSNSEYTDDNEIEKLDFDLSNNRILIKTKRSCLKPNSTYLKYKEYFNCFHNGVCKSKYVYLNETYYKQVFFCLCQTVSIN